MERTGVLAGGNFIVDVVKLIDMWPPIESLANIKHQYSSNGGGAYNLLKDMSRLKVTFPLEAVGLVGDDYYGEWIQNDCNSCGIDTKQLQSAQQAITSFTDVMTLQTGGKRTFFHYRGANALVKRSSFDLKKSNAKIFHLAYMLLLDQLDVLDENGVSEAAKLLHEAKQLNFITSADLVSVNDDNFQKIIFSSLPFVDFLFLNEFEAEKLTGISVIENGELQPENAVEACWQIIKMGVQQWVILHFPGGVVAVNENREALFQGSVQFPFAAILGAVGAGDAFAAGVLTGVHENFQMKDALRLGVCVACACLTHATSSDGIGVMKDCLTLGEQYGFREIT